MTSKKHYVAIASRMSEIYNGIYEQSEFDMFDKVLFMLCDTFEQDSPRFDRVKFIEACTS